LPLECLHSEADTITFVYKRDGMNKFKQEVVVGETNANDAVVISGLAESDRIYLSVPAGLEGEEVRLLPEMNGKRRKKDSNETAPAAGPITKAAQQ
jgi:hypothetical protein